MIAKPLESIVSLVGLVVGIPACTVGLAGPPPPYVPRPIYPPPAGRVVFAPPPSGSPSQEPPATPNQGSPAGPECSDPGARDFPDRFDQAVPIDGQSQTVGCITSRDADMFLLTPPPAKGGQIIRFSLRGQNAMAPIIRLFDGDRKKLVQFGAPRSGEARGWVHASGAKPIYVEVDEDFGSIDTYILTLTTEPLADTGEPNDDMSKATPLREGVPLTAFMSEVANNPAAAEDWYRLDMKHEGPVTIDVDMSPGVAPRIMVFDADRRRVGETGGERGERIHLSMKLRRGIYYARVDSSFGMSSAGEGELAARLTRPYTINVH